MTTVAIIDRHPIVRIGLAGILTNHFLEICVLQSESVSAFQLLFPNESPHLTILGITDSSEADNLANIRLLRSQNTKGALILFDDRPNPSLALFYLKARVNGYIAKHNKLSELIDCIAEVLGGKYYIGLDMMDSVIDKVFDNLVSPDTKRGRLTAKQYEVAMYLAEGMSISWIANQLGKTIGTVSSSKKTIYKKLDVDNILKLREIINMDNWEL